MLVLFKLVGVVAVVAAFVFFGLYLWLESDNNNTTYKGTKESKILGTVLLVLGITILVVCVSAILTAQTIGGVLIVLLLSGSILWFTNLRTKVTGS